MESNNKPMTREVFKERWLPAIAIMLTVVISVTSASYRVGMKIGYVEARISALERFANEGERWTAKDGLADRQRISELEAEFRNLPPDWFEQQQRNTQVELDETRKEVTDLKFQIAALKVTVKDLLQFITVEHESLRDAR